MRHREGGAWRNRATIVLALERDGQLRAHAKRRTGSTCWQRNPHGEIDPRRLSAGRESGAEGAGRAVGRAVLDVVLEVAKEGGEPGLIPFRFDCFL